jgi:hypothetical protein
LRVEVGEFSKTRAPNCGIARLAHPWVTDQECTSAVWFEGIKFGSAIILFFVLRSAFVTLGVRIHVVSGYGCLHAHLLTRKQVV